MKKTKIVLPLLAFVLAIAGVFVSRQSKAAAMTAPDYYYNQQDVCTQVPGLSCDTFGLNVCMFDAGAGYTTVYESKAGGCAGVLRHSQNGGFLN